MDAISIERTLEQFLEGRHGVDLVLARLRNALSGGNFQTSFNPDELRWLSYNFLKIPVILHSPLACKIFTSCYSQKGVYLRQLTHRLRKNSTAPVLY